jgi:transcriptional regulator with XRE-family HTH domain
MELSDSIRAARQLAKMSGKEVADALDMSAAAYRRYERGEVVPSAQVILDLAQLFKCSPNAVMQTGGVDPQATASNVQQLDLDLKEGETLTIVVNATVKPANIQPIKNEPYAPKVSSLPRSTAAKKRA